MPFSKTLNDFCTTLGCTNKDLAALCGISPSTLSRYRKGTRTPDAGSATVVSLAAGLAMFSRRSKAGEPLREEDVLEALEASLAATRMVGMDFNMRFDTLVHLLGIRNTQMAEAAGVDPSYISRIRKGDRKPADLEAFLEPCARIMANVCLEKNLIADVEELIGPIDMGHENPLGNIEPASNLAETMGVWIAGNRIFNSDITGMDKLLRWLDNTDFSSWLDAGVVDRNASEPPIAPVVLARFYYGIDGMRNAEIDFLTTAAETHARELSMSSDMPLLQMELDHKFIARYKRGIANLLKTGCHVNIIHSVERPLEETIEALRLWIPLYMTGRVTPAYLKGVNSRLFFHVNYVCDTCALSSEAVIGHQEDGRYFFTTRPSDVAYYQKKMGFILERASSLLEVYRDCEPDRKEAFEQAEARRQAKGEGRRIGADRLQNVRVVSYPGDCTVLSVPCRASTVHFVIRHPKINYAIAHMK